jgi:hypothetical protein
MLQTRNAPSRECRHSPEVTVLDAAPLGKRKKRREKNGGSGGRWEKRRERRDLGTGL